MDFCFLILIVLSALYNFNLDLYSNHRSAIYQTVADIWKTYAQGGYEYSVRNTAKGSVIENLSKNGERDH